MATLKTPRHPGARIAVGDAVLEASKHVDTGAVKKRLEAFRRVHQGYSRAETALEGKRARLAAQQAKVGELDVGQDDAVDVLASALVGEGEPRTAPFRSSGAPAPSVLKDLGYGVEAKALRSLAGKVQKRKNLQAAARKAAVAAEKAAKAVETALKAMPALVKAVAAAQVARDALAQPWETSFAALKRAARAAEDDGHKGLFAALFQPPADAAPVKRPASRPRRGGGGAAGGGGTPGR